MVQIDMGVLVLLIVLAVITIPLTVLIVGTLRLANRALDMPDQQQRRHALKVLRELARFLPRNWWRPDQHQPPASRPCRCRRGEIDP